MKRRRFFAAAGVATLASIPAAARPLTERQNDRQILELRRYVMPLGSGQQRLHTFLEDVAVPAFNRIGVSPVGAFTVLYGQTEPTLYVLLPHASAADFFTSGARLMDDPAYGGAVETSMEEAHYVRYDNRIMLAFEGMPRVEAPDTSQPRIFELRTYESHNEQKARRKIEMFDKGEIDIFRATKLTPVFFGESLAGDRLPNLTYMITHSDMAARDEHWKAFTDHPDWKTMSADPYYAETVSNISNVVLRPTGYSQI
jgi:hypothetical protein